MMLPTLSRKLISFFKALKWPSRCFLCHEQSERAWDCCHDCERALPYLPQLRLQNDDRLQSIPNLRIFSLFNYEAPIQQLLFNLKFKHHLVNAHVLGHLMADTMEAIYKKEKKPDIIIPVPLQAARLFKRGFNQSIELAKPISQRLKIPLDRLSCIQSRHTLPQSSLSLKERYGNMDNAFFIHPTFNQKHVCIIDDVIVTGGTIFSMIESLINHNVKKIDVWSCARVS